jgi:hypothetical protein
LLVVVGVAAAAARVVVAVAAPHLVSPLELDEELLCLRRRCSILDLFLFMPSLLNSGLNRRGNRMMGAKVRCRDRTRKGIRNDIANAIGQPLQKINNESLLICKGLYLYLKLFLLSAHLSLEMQNPASKAAYCSLHQSIQSSHFVWATRGSNFFHACPRSGCPKLVAWDSVLVSQKISSRTKQ